MDDNTAAVLIMAVTMFVVGVMVWSANRNDR